MLRSGFIWHEDRIPDTARLQIRTVLMTDWDPIGVNGIPEAAGEYDDYSPRIYQLLTTNATTGEVQRYLFEVVDERMRMSPPTLLEHMSLAAEALKQLDFRS